MSERHILVIGSGSVGQRHARNLRRLGCAISCVDPRQDRLDAMGASDVSMLHGWQTLEEALQNARFDGAVVASPPSFHVSQSEQCLRGGIPVLLEKPVSPDLQSALHLAAVVDQGDVPLLLGYTWRWWPSLLEVRERVQAGVIGKVLHVQFCMSAHLADWHPWEPYQEFFMASRALGGGALLDESHWIDQMLWFFGVPCHVSGEISKVSALEIDTDDNVDMQACFANGLRVSLHLDLFGRPHEKSITFRGDEGTLIWEVDRYLVGRGMERSWEEHLFSHERNDMFVAAAREFLEVIDRRARPSCDIHDGIAVMRVVEAVRRSSCDGSRVAMEMV